MKITLIILFFLFIPIMLISQAGGNRDELPELKDPYLGQKPPGKTPEIFAPGFISTGMHEAALVFSPGLDEIYYELTHLTHRFTAIVCVKSKDGEWQSPEVAPFSGKYMDASPFVTPDNKRLFFCSNRPVKKDHDPQDFDLWFVERKKDGWSDPICLGPEVNSRSVDVNPCVTDDGTLYFASNRDGGQGGHDIYRSRMVGGQYQVPVNIGEPVNTNDFESSPYVSPDESYLIFNVFTGPGSDRKSGLYVTYLKKDGTWCNPIRMGEEINGDGPGMFPWVSPDSRQLFFTSQRVPYLPYGGEALTYERLRKMLTGPSNGSGDIYWVDAGVIEELRAEN